MQRQIRLKSMQGHCQKLNYYQCHSNEQPQLALAGADPTSLDHARAAEPLAKLAFTAQVEILQHACSQQELTSLT